MSNVTGSQWMNGSAQDAEVCSPTEMASPAPAANDALHDDPESAAHDALTPAERRVLGCAELGWSNKLVAYSLGISRSTVATLLARARKKLARHARTRINDHLMLLSVPVEAAPDELAAGLLTAAEKSVVYLALSGLSNTAIARQRQSSPWTVAKQLAAAYKKLGVGSRRELRVKLGR